MKKELEDKLFSDFPDIFPGGRAVDPRESLVCFGFDCGDGWFDIIYELCRAIQKDCDDSGKYQVVALQVKEKFGLLRFYVDSGSDETYRLIEAAEEKSVETCEICGKPGKLDQVNGWWQTTCEKHGRKD